MCVGGGGVGSLFCIVALSVLSSLAIILRKRELVALLELCCGCLHSVSLPHGVMGWSAVCDCGISWSYPLTFANNAESTVYTD